MTPTAHSEVAPASECFGTDLVINKGVFVGPQRLGADRFFECGLLSNEPNFDYSLRALRLSLSL